MSHSSSPRGLEATVKHYHTNVERVIVIEPPDMICVAYVLPLAGMHSLEGIRRTIENERTVGVVFHVLGADDIGPAVLEIAKHAATQERLKVEARYRRDIEAHRASLAALPRWVRWLVGYFSS